MGKEIKMNPNQQNQQNININPDDLEDVIWVGQGPEPINEEIEVANETVEEATSPLDPLQKIFDYVIEKGL